MDHRKIIYPESLNDQGFLFGGNLLKWVDEYAYITATLEFPGNRFVTIGLDNVEFKHPIKPGEILRVVVERTRLGTTSVSYQVSVYGEKFAAKDQILFATAITFVNVDRDGNKTAIQQSVATP